MKVRYFADTDTLLIEFQDAAVAETRDFDEDTVLDVDGQRQHLRHHDRRRVSQNGCSSILLRTRHRITMPIETDRKKRSSQLAWLLNGSVRHQLFTGVI